MNIHRTQMSLDNPKINEERSRIINFWNGLRVCGDPGETTWKVLDSLERQVTEYLNHDPPNMKMAESLTATAALAIGGHGKL